MKKLILMLAAASLAASPIFAQHGAKTMPWERKANAAQKGEALLSDKLKSLWADPVLQEKIALGIENNRKGDFYLTFIDQKKRPVKVDNLKVEMLRHDFLFGAQIFLLGGFKTEEENRLYEKHFLELFNFATVPFYWKAYEQKDGVYQFAKDVSAQGVEHLYRRPSQDAIVEFCNKNGLKMKGHTLAWYINKFGLPEWTPREGKLIEKYMCRYIDKIAERYNGDINIWDVANESSDTQDHYKTPNYFPTDHVFKAFKEAERAFSYNNEFIMNYTTPVWMRVARYHEYATDYLLTSDILARGGKLDIIGLQLHYFKKADREALMAGESWTPDELFDVLDTFSRLNKPIHITEISFPCMAEGKVGEEKQAFLFENFYKLWFSHPKVKAITYWHFVDGTAGSEDVFNSGIIRRDFSKKPAYDVLDRLINKEWRTDLSFDKSADEFHFRCFYGTYKVSFERNGKKYEQTVILNKNVRKHAYITVE